VAAYMLPLYCQGLSRQLKAALRKSKFFDCACGNLRRVFEAGLADFDYLLGDKFS
jgi:hypothetical protein